jgi:PAS domain S-box-containing protein
MTEKAVLIIDDDDDLRDSLGDILDDEGWGLLSAATCASGLRLADEHRPDAVLLDLKLPDGWGTSLLPDLKKINPDCACIIMTGYADLDSAMVAVERGAFQFLRKPVRIEELIQTLRGIFETARLRNEKRQAEEAVLAMNRELQEVNSRLRLIVRSARTLASCTHLERFGTIFLEEIARNMAADGGSLYFRRGDSLVLAHSLDPEHAPATIPLPVKKGSVLDLVMSAGETVCLQDIGEQHDLAPSGWNGYRDGSLLAFPLAENGSITGAVLLHNKTHPPFTLQDRELGSILVSYSGEVVRSMRALEALRMSEEKFRSLSENAPDIILTLDADGAIAYVNPAWEKILGYPRQDVLGKPFVQFAREEDARNYVRVFKRIRDRREIVRDLSGCLLDIKGTERHFNMSGAPKVDSRNNVTGILGICKDTTEQRQLEGQLQHAQKMEAVGTLAGGISHDLNNILQAISGYTQLLLMKRDPRDSDWNYLNLVENSAQRAADLIRRLLVFSQKVESKKSPLVLNREIDQARKLLDRALPRMIDIRLDLAADIATIHADPVQIEQIIMNLVMNARDAMPDGGALVIETRNIVLRKPYLDIKPGAYVLLTVSDSGHGMDPETIKHIFEPFFTTKDVGKGTGLGLAMVYGIVKSHDAHIICDSEPGVGTTFRIYFPAVEAESGPHETEPAGDEKTFGGTETILLVDDETTLLELGHVMLNRFGYKVMTAGSGEDAVEMYKDHKGSIDLIILDLNMPGMGGHKCLEELRRIDTTARILVASGCSPDDKMRETLRSSGCRFISKPYRLQDVLKNVKEVLEGAPTDD